MFCKEYINWWRFNSFMPVRLEHFSFDANKKKWNNKQSSEEKSRCSDRTTTQVHIEHKFFSEVHTLNSILPLPQNYGINSTWSSCFMKKTMEFHEKKLIARELHVSEIPKFTCTTYRRKMIKWKKGLPNPFHRKAKKCIKFRDKSL